MIAKILSFLILAPIAIVLVIFFVANRGEVPITLDPFGSIPQLTYSVPLFYLLMGSLVVGLILGGIGTFLTQSHYRRLAWKRKYEIERLRRENEDQKSRLRMMQEDRDRSTPPAVGTGSSQAMLPMSRAAA
ncbi:LapA family protein [Jiella marina]|uniref:LapA family protein n=1 Tax=Jiella sp. LLJ827 TaxID=2917712 RepID=UPI002101CCD3|nr:LapA family protein [Jiella sp. LLJ827]MCQ0989509.1 LapA family protein [Jiella sp. LLJ827]